MVSQQTIHLPLSPSSITRSTIATKVFVFIFSQKESRSESIR